MVFYTAVIISLIYCTALSNCQDGNSQDFEGPSNNSQTVSHVDFDYPETNLWLISEDDPIPVRLRERWSAGHSASSFQIQNNARTDRGILPFNLPLNSENLSHLTLSVPLQLKGINYGTANQKRSSDGNDAVATQYPDAVLVQLPADITNGLWERPQRPFLESEKTKQSAPHKNTGTVRNNLPVKELNSRLPVTGNQPLENTDSQRERYIPHQTPPVLSVSSVGILPGSSSRTDYNGEEILILSEPIRSHLQNGYDGVTHRSDVGQEEYSNILTGEDIEFLQRLGILSSLAFEPRNSTIRFSSTDNFKREYESNPFPIDNDGKSYTVHPEKNDSSDFVLIDLSQFSASDYQKNIRENSTPDHAVFRISPYLLLPSQNENSFNKSKEFINSVIDNELIKIFQNLTQNTEDLLNVSFLESSTFLANLPKQSRKENSSTDLHFIQLEADDLATEINSSKEKIEKEHSAAAISGIPTSVKLNNDRNDALHVNNQVSSTSLVNQGKIQPRLLDRSDILHDNTQFTAKPLINGRVPARLPENTNTKENEVFQKVLEKAMPVSESKFKILKKLENFSHPYFFGFRQNDGNGTIQHRNETSDAQGVVKGSYGYRDALGVYRNVNYIADDNGFHAVVKTNEPGTVSHSTADAVVMSEVPPLAALLKMRAYVKPKVSSESRGKQ